MACNGALSDSGGICGTIIGYAPVFYGILEFLQAGFSNHTRPCPFGRTCGMGICKVSFSREKDTLYLVYCPDADAISGDHGFQLSCSEQTGPD